MKSNGVHGFPFIWEWVHHIVEIAILTIWNRMLPTCHYPVEEPWLKHSQASRQSVGHFLRGAFPDWLQAPSQHPGGSQIWVKSESALGKEIFRNFAPNTLALFFLRTTWYATRAATTRRTRAAKIIPISIGHCEEPVATESWPLSSRGMK